MTESRKSDEDHACRRRTRRLERPGAARRTFAILSAWPQSSSGDMTEPSDVGHAIAGLRTGDPDIALGAAWFTTNQETSGLWNTGHNRPKHPDSDL